MNNYQERRKHVRYLSENLTVEIGSNSYPVINISTGGVFFKATGYYAGNPVKITIRSVKDSRDFVTADCKVVESRQDCVHAEFAKPTMPLMHFVIGHIGQAMGVAPQYFKKPGAA